MRDGFIFVLIATLLTACGTVATNPTATDTPSGPPTPTPVVIEGFSISMESWFTVGGESVSALRVAFPRVFVGIIEGVRYEWEPIYPARTLVPRPGVTVVGKSLRSGEPPETIRSYFSIRVVESFDSGLRPGDTVTVYQSGGEYTRDDGVIMRTSSDGLPRVGGTYLLFTRDHPTLLGMLWAPGWGKYLVVDDQLSPISDFWARLGVTNELAATSLDEVRPMLTHR